MIGVALPNLNISQYPTAVQTISKAKKTNRLMAESLEIFNQYSHCVDRYYEDVCSCISISQIYVDSLTDVMENKK